MAFCNHQRKGNQGGIGDALGAVWPIEDAVVLHEPEEQGGSNAFVPIHKGVVFYYKVEQHSRLFLYAGIEVLPIPGLVNLADGTMERRVLFNAEQVASAEFALQAMDSLHRILIGGMEALRAFRSSYFCWMRLFWTT